MWLYKIYIITTKLQKNQFIKYNSLYLCYAIEI